MAFSAGSAELAETAANGNDMNDERLIFLIFQGLIQIKNAHITYP